VEFLQLVIGVWPRRDPHFLEKLEGHQLKVVRRARLGERRLTRCWSSSGAAATPAASTARTPRRRGLSSGRG
jgi:hypothetical protein